MRSLLAFFLQVKVLYVRNLMLSTTEVQIMETFSSFGVVERVKKIKDYAFVHFQSRQEAHKAMEAMNGESALVGLAISGKFLQCWKRCSAGWCRGGGDFGQASG